MHRKLFAGLLLLSLAGCGGDTVVFEDTFDLPIEGWFRTVKVSSKQSMKHRFTAAAVEPINVFVYLGADDQAVKAGLQDGAVIARVLGHQKNTKQVDFEANLPPESEAVVYLTRAGNATNVKIKIIAKK